MQLNTNNNVEIFIFLQYINRQCLYRRVKQAKIDDLPVATSLLISFLNVLSIKEFLQFLTYECDRYNYSYPFSINGIKITAESLNMCIFQGIQVVSLKPYIFDIDHKQETFLVNRNDQKNQIIEDEVSKCQLLSWEDVETLV